MKGTHAAVVDSQPIADIRFRCLLSWFGGAPACRVPARRPGNFHLRPQMKVTKAKGLNATPLMSAARVGSPARRATGDIAAAWPAGALAGAGFAGARPRNAKTLDPRPTRSEALPARRRNEPRRGVQWPAGRGSEACRTSEWFCIRALCFGGFHLGLQMKVTRPPGRDPAGRQTTKPASIDQIAKVRNGLESAITYDTGFILCRDRVGRFELGVLLAVGPDVADFV